LFAFHTRKISLKGIAMAETPVETRTEDRMPTPAVTSANGADSAPAVPEEADDAERLRGVVALPYQRDILFTDEVTLATDPLPRWQPQIIVDERRLFDEDHE
jgi:hypothetical protein